MMRLTFAALLAVAACTGDETVRAYGGGDIVWQLQEIDGAPFRARATLEFPDDGGVAGSAPCNRYTATMAAPYPWFETGPIAATRRACPDLDAEADFLQKLSRARIVEVAGQTLILSNEDGLSMIFTAAD